MITTRFFWNKDYYVLSESHTMGGVFAPPIYLKKRIIPTLQAVHRDVSCYNY